MAVEGLQELDRALVSLGKQSAGKLARSALRDGAKIIQRQAQANAPARSGKTRRAIRVRAGKGRRGEVHVAVTIGKKFFQGDQFYAAFQEFGYHHGSRKLGDRRKLIPGKHFIERAFDQAGPAAAQAVVDSLKAGIEDVGRSE